MHRRDIENMVKEMLDVGIVKPRQISFSTPVMMVCKKKGSWCMYSYYREIYDVPNHG